MVPPIIVLAIVMCGSAVLITGMGLMARYLSLRRTSAQSLTSEEIARRLERIEQAVETMAVEVERLGESDRFVAKLLASKTDSLQR
jgi:hypothetical protein